MSIANTITPPSYYGDDRYKMALVYMDRLFQYYPDFESFILYNIISEYIIDNKERKDALDLQGITEELLIDKFNYAERVKGSYQICLTDLGRKIKKVGGHENYEKSMNPYFNPALVIPEFQKYINPQPINKAIEEVKTHHPETSNHQFTGTIINHGNLNMGANSTIQTNDSKVQEVKKEESKFQKFMGNTKVLIGVISAFVVLASTLILKWDSIITWIRGFIN